MTPTDASISSLSRSLTQLTTESGDKPTSNYGSNLFDGKQVSISEQDNPCNVRTIVRTMVPTNSAILEPPYNVNCPGFEQYKAVSKPEFSGINALKQDNPETEVKEILCSMDEDSASASEVVRKLDMAYSKNNLSLAREVATLPAANAYLIELSSGNHPSSNEQVKFLLQTGVDPNAGATGKQTPLYIATKSQNIELVEHLLRAKADPNALASGEETPLYQAAVSELWAMERHPDCVQKLKRSTEEYNQYCSKMENYVEVAKKLLAAGADPDPLYQTVDTLLHDVGGVVSPANITYIKSSKLSGRLS